MNISVGVSDAGLGSGFGITILSSDEEIQAAAQRFQEVCNKV